ncbi:hypothetical protein HKX48_004624 [Thoreauomyces humboldtii]|nr:hypothetical protein HKX48_004624 [Thoreauomyces humboldtii]
MDVQTALTVSLASRLLPLLTNLSETHDRTILYLDSVANLQAQRTDTRAYVSPPTTPAWMNPNTTPKIVQEFPDLVSRMLGKQTRAQERALASLHEELRGLDQLVTLLQVLRTEAVIAAQPTHSAPFDPTSAPFDPTHITPVELAGWISELALQFGREVAAKRVLLDGLNLSEEAGNVQEVRDRWGSQSWINLERESEIRDRWKLMKSTLDRLS